MEPVWNGMLTCDYERTRPAATPLGWDLYTTSLITWPAVLMDEPAPYGRLRRPGIVDIDLADHQWLTGLWHARLADPDLVTDLITRTRHDRAAATHALDECDTSHASGNATAFTTAMAAATAAILRVSSTHIVNWLLPEQHWEILLTHLLGTRTQALTCLSALQLPDEPGHILAAHTRHTPKESSQVVLSSRTRAQRSRDAWRLAALAAAGDQPVLAEVRALPAVLGWAAGSEERRNELRARFLALIAAWCETTGHDPSQITTTDLLATPA